MPSLEAWTLIRCSCQTPRKLHHTGHNVEEPFVVVRNRVNRSEGLSIKGEEKRRGRKGQAARSIFSCGMYRSLISRARIDNKQPHPPFISNLVAVQCRQLHRYSKRQNLHSQFLQCAYTVAQEYVTYAMLDYTLPSKEL
jgi:hypothetical protein